jgi:archaellum component FlaG (FlaF/FlaG flagellin family)
LQALAGIVSVFLPWVPRLAASALLGSGGVFGVLSNWAFRLSENANTRLDRIAGDEKARELIAAISDPKKRDEELSRFVKALAVRAK